MEKNKSSNAIQALIRLFSIYIHVKCLFMLLETSVNFTIVEEFFFINCTGKNSCNILLLATVFRTQSDSTDNFGLDSKHFSNFYYKIKKILQIFFPCNFSLIFFSYRKNREKLSNSLNVIITLKLCFFFMIFPKDFSQIINGSILIAIWFNLKLKSFSFSKKNKL